MLSWKLLWIDSAPIECCSFSEGRKEIERKERRKEATEETKKGKKKGRKKNGEYNIKTIQRLNFDACEKTHVHLGLIWCIYTRSLSEAMIGQVWGRCNIVCM